MPNFKLELLHAADQEAGIPAIVDAPNFSAVLNALKAEDLGNDGELDNTLILSSGDAYIPGLFFSASSDVFGAQGIADILIQNELGFQAIAFGNHEFDLGTSLVSDLIRSGTLADGSAYPGTNFPYLSANLDFSTDDNLADLVVADGEAPQPNSIAASTVIDVNGEKIGVVGATTPTLPTISSPGGVTVLPEDFDGTPSDAQLDALAAEIQADVDALLAKNPEVNKVIVLSHMQQIAIEQALAERLTDVDIIVAGGSNTLLADETDVLRAGDEVEGPYPIIKTDAEGNPVAVVNTDGNYNYVGRLVIDFDENGIIIPESYDPAVSGAYATDADGVAALNAQGLVDPEIQDIVDQLEAVIVAKESNVFGVSNVYLDGRRDSVRTEETNLGNLTADANLAIAREITGDDSIVVSIKNGGGIRDDIGQVIVPPGGTGEPVELPNEGIPDVKPDGGISETDIANALRFNNGLTVLDITREGLVAVLEHGVAETTPDDSSTPGRFPQVSGVEFSFDATAEAGDRIQSAAIKDAEGNIIDILVEDGEFVGEAGATVKIVTLGFLAGGGDGYPFQDFGSNFTELDQEEDAPRTGEATFAPDGSEQDALAEYLADNFTEATPFDQAETSRAEDTRIQNLGFREDTVLGAGTGEPTEPEFPNGFDGPFEKIGSLELEDGAEINAYDPESKQLFVVSGEPILQVVDLSDPSQPVALESIDLSEFGAGINSVAVKNGLLAVALEADTATDHGKVVFLNASSGEVLNDVTVGALPDMLTFTPDGKRVLVANEGEPDDQYIVDPEGSISVINLSNGVDHATVHTADFTHFNHQKAELQEEGVKLFGPEGTTVAQDLEPEYIAVNGDGTKAWITLQENNAVAVLDIHSATVEDILPLGFKDFSTDAKLDASNRDDGINLQNWPVFGLYQPDAIASYVVDGETYYITANEGDARIRPDGDLELEDGTEIEEGAIFNEESRIKDVDLDPTAFPNADELQKDENLGRLKITDKLGDTDGDGDFDELYSFGGRSFSIWDSKGNLVFDSGDQIARITAELTPELFNANDGDPEEFDNRSDDKGAEPEAVTIGQIGDTIYAFVGLERAGGGVLVYDVTNPQAPEFVQYARDDQDIAPEGVSFISSEDSPNGNNLLIVTNEESSTLAIYEAEAVIEPIAELLDLTGVDGDITAGVTLEREAFFDNLLQFYKTDALGTVDGIKPGEAGYEDAVRKNLLDMPQLFVNNLTTQETDIMLAGGTFYAPALLVDGNINNLVTIDDAVTGMSMIKRDGDVWSFEDLHDFDFNDLIFTINSVSATPDVA